jgi:hypothetical protein
VFAVIKGIIGKIMSEDQANNKISPATYEFALLQHLRHEFERRGFKVCGTENGKKHFVKGRFSLTDRQLDVAVYCPGEAMPFLVADAKRHGRKIDVKKIESFIGMLDDVNASIGILVAPLGFTKPAIRRAEAANITVETMSPTEALEFKWLPFARSIYPWDWIFHLELAKALKHLKERAEPQVIIDALDGVAFEEWENFVKYALIHHNEEAVQMLETIVFHHFDIGWRYNAVRLLEEYGDLSTDIVEFVQSYERDPDILEFIRLYCDEK